MSAMYEVLTSGHATSGSWNDLNGIPADIADGDTDTHEMQALASH